MEIPTITESVCFKLHLATRTMTALYKPFLKKANLTFTQFMVMGLLWEKDKQTIKTLGAKLHLDSGTLTPLIKRLEAMDLLKRTKSNEDERSNIISLTNQGKKMYDLGVSSAIEFYSKLKMSEEELNEIKGLLDNWLQKELVDYQPTSLETKE